MFFFGQRCRSDIQSMGMQKGNKEKLVEISRFCPSWEKKRNVNKGKEKRGGEKRKKRIIWNPFFFCSSFSKRKTENLAFGDQGWGILWFFSSFWGNVFFFFFVHFVILDVILRSGCISCFFYTIGFLSVRLLKERQSHGLDITKKREGLFLKILLQLFINSLRSHDVFM